MSKRQNLTLRSQAINAVISPEPISPHLNVATTESTQNRVRRDTFSMPEGDHERIRELQKQFQKEDILLNKSEIIRVGLLALQQMSPSDRMKAVHALTRIKVGRPVP